MPGTVRPRGSLNFNKPPLCLDELVDRLVDRGLVVRDRERARRYLRHIGYTGCRRTRSHSVRALTMLCARGRRSTTSLTSTSSTALCASS